MDLTPEDVEDILALLDSLPYDELDLRTSRFRLTLRRTSDGWTQSTTSSNPEMSDLGGAVEGIGADRLVGEGPVDRRPVNDGPVDEELVSRGLAGEGLAGEGLVAVRAPLPGTFYRAPRPGAAPFVDVGSRVEADTVVGIVETMKLMNSVHAGAPGRVAEICLGNAEFAASGAVLLRIEADL